MNTLWFQDWPSDDTFVSIFLELDYLPPCEKSNSLAVVAEPCRCELLDGLLGVDTDTEEHILVAVAVVDIVAGMTVVDTAVDTCLAAAADIEAYILVEVHILDVVVGKGRDC